MLFKSEEVCHFDFRIISLIGQQVLSLTNKEVKR